MSASSVDRDVPLRWVVAFVGLAIAATALTSQVATAFFCSAARPDRGFSLVWFLIGVALYLFASLPGLVAGLLGRRVIRISAAEQWNEIRSHIGRMSLLVLAGTAVTVISVTAIWLWAVGALTAAILTVLLATTVSLLAGKLAAYAAEAAKATNHISQVCFRLVSLGIAGFAGTISPWLAATIAMCRYPDGFGGLLFSIGVMPAVIAVTLVYLLGANRAGEV